MFSSSSQFEGLPLNDELSLILKAYLGSVTLLQVELVQVFQPVVNPQPVNILTIELCDLSGVIYTLWNKV